ncbi:unnamed protein product [Boreogadus saida]
MNVCCLSADRRLLSYPVPLQGFKGLPGTDPAMMEPLPGELLQLNRKTHMAGLFMISPLSADLSWGPDQALY